MCLITQLIALFSVYFTSQALVSLGLNIDAVLQWKIRIGQKNSLSLPAPYTFDFPEGNHFIINFLKILYLVIMYISIDIVRFIVAMSCAVVRILPMQEAWRTWVQSLVGRFLVKWQLTEFGRIISFRHWSTTFHSDGEGFLPSIPTPFLVLNFYFPSTPISIHIKQRKWGEIH